MTRGFSSSLGDLNKDSGEAVLVVGAGGMLGRAWTALLEERRIPRHRLDYPDFDLGGAKAEQVLRRFLEENDIGLVVNCAAWTDVDAAEEREAAAERINGGGVATLALVCRERGARLVHYSTDYVFDGRGGQPYRPDHPLAPINAYGRSKAKGERALLEASGLDYRLIRASWLYAPWGKNFVRTMAKLTAARERIEVVDDQRGRPTSAEHLARTSLRLVETGVSGIFHVSDGGECTWYELARFIGEQVNRGCRVEPCTSEQFPRAAKRPAYSVLDLSATEALVGPMPDWRGNVKEVLHRLEPTKT